ncbi:MAG: flagellar assembly factor FliW [Paenibacillaceae bacterium]|nr:flagellar assembly factor FliW [Paenibacillaceae bacterium]
MIIDSAWFGELEVKDEEVLTFLQGMPGFESHQKYVLLKPEELSPFAYLQSVEERELSFLTVDPFAVYPQYDFMLSTEVQEELGIVSEQDVKVLAVVTSKENVADMTMNLLAPLIFNVREKTGKQVVLHNTSYSVKHALLQAEEHAGSEG